MILRACSLLDSYSSPNDTERMMTPVWLLQASWSWQKVYSFINDIPVQMIRREKGRYLVNSIIIIITPSQEAKIILHEYFKSKKHWQGCHTGLQIVKSDCYSTVTPDNMILRARSLLCSCSSPICTERMARPASFSLARWSGEND